MAKEHDEDDEDLPASFASPPCFLHELDPGFAVLRSGSDPLLRPDVLRWRKSERDRLIRERVAIPPAERRALTVRIATALDEVLGSLAGVTVGVYWPMRGEPDLRPWMERVAERGGFCALPVVVQKRAPLAFRTWRRGERLEPGFWNIPVPAAGREVTPAVVIAPLVGFDRACYRLGYGGGYFDRTLAQIDPVAVGVGFECGRVASVHPQPHDKPMHWIVTEAGAQETVIG